MNRLRECFERLRVEDFELPLEKSAVSSVKKQKKDYEKRETTDDIKKKFSTCLKKKIAIPHLNLTKK